MMMGNGDMGCLRQTWWWWTREHPVASVWFREHASCTYESQWSGCVAGVLLGVFVSKKDSGVSSSEQCETWGDGIKNQEGSLD